MVFGGTGNGQGPRADMAGNTQRKMIHIAFVSREGLKHLIPEDGRRFIIIRVCNIQPHIRVIQRPVKALYQIVFNGINHDLLSLCRCSRFSKGIQLLSLYLQHWLDFKDSAQSGGRGVILPPRFK